MKVWKPELNTLEQ